MALPLFRRFPRLRAPASDPVLKAEHAVRYPALAADLAVLDEVVTPAFAELDEAALRDQNRYRRQQVVVLLGSALATGLGGLQAVFPGQRWPGVLLGLFGIAVAFSSHLADEGKTQAGYLEARVRAERLRALYFRYASMTGRYAGADRLLTLRGDVLSIQRGKEPG